MNEIKAFKKALLKMENNELRKIMIYPDEANIRNIYFLLHGDGKYEGGEYVGLLMLHEEHPSKPPDIKILTPNGRFEVDRKICFSFTAFHPDSWRPVGWTIQTLLMGLYSAWDSEVTADLQGLGHIKRPDEEIKRLAEVSKEYNLSHHNILYCKLKEEESRVILELSRG